MGHVHESSGPRLLDAPGNFVWGRFVTDDNTDLRYGHLSPAQPWMDCILLGGFCEFTEKYFELTGDLAKRGIAAWSLDWRGQGGSQRPTHRPHRPRGRDFDRDVADLKCFSDFIGSKQRPRVVIAHSMGGAIALKALRTFPGLVDAAVLCAPMLAVATGALSRIAARLVAELACATGLGGALIPGLSFLDGAGAPTPETSVTSHDPKRCRLVYDWFAARPDLRLDGITFGWYRNALRFAAEFADPTAFSGMTTPVLVGLAGQDSFVDNAPTRAFISHIPQVTLMEFPAARHELFHERDDIRDQWLAAVDAFLAARFSRPAP
jgi:lysophospholipase